MLTMTTKQFRAMIREANLAFQMYTNPCAKEGARNVGAMISRESDLDKFVDIMKKNGHDPEAHNIRLTDSRANRFYYGSLYIRGVAKYEE